MAEKSATPEEQSELAFQTGFDDTAPAAQTEKVETKPKDEKPETKPVAKAEEKPKKAEPKAEKAPAPEHVQITKEQFDRLMASANETDSLKAQMSKAFGTIGNVQQLVNRLQESTPKGEAIKLPKTVVAKLEKDFPELAELIFDALDQAHNIGARGTGDKPATEQPKIVEDKPKATEDRDAKRIEREMVVLEDAYPDWKKIVGAVGPGEKPDPQHPYRAWLATQPESYQALINDTDDARLIERSITRFKEAEAAKAKATKKPEETKPNPKTESRRQALSEAVQPRGAGHEAPQAKTEADHFSEGFSSG